MWPYHPPPPPPPQLSSFSFYPPAHYPQYPAQDVNRGIQTHYPAQATSEYYAFGYNPALPGPLNSIDSHAPRPTAPTYYEAFGVPGPTAPHHQPFSQGFLGLPAPHVARPRTLPSPSTVMAPSRRYQIRPATRSNNRAVAGSSSAQAPAVATRHPPFAVPTASAPVKPCANGRCHFHRLRCHHVVKTALAQPPTACATNCATAPLDGRNPADAADAFGPEPFECPVCVADMLSLLWKMDVVNLRNKQMAEMPFEAFKKWVRENNVAAWEQRKRVRLAEWMGPEHCRRPCGQLSVREARAVVWEAGEQKAPYPIEGFRQVYEQRQVRPEFWTQTYHDYTLGEAGDEAMPGVVMESVERPGVDFPAEWAQ